MNRLTRKWSTARRAGLLGLALTLGGCAVGPGGGSIYVPAGASTSPERAPAASSEPARGPDSAAADAPRPRSEPEPDRSPSYQDQGEQLSAAAATLVRRADTLLASGDPRGAVGQLERAQRISPRSPEVYFKLAEAYVAMDQLGAAEQFARKGLSLAGSNTRLQRAGWLMLADIRRARGNLAGANAAEQRAAAL